MAQDRFYFWRGYYDALSGLGSDELAGRFVLMLCAYAFDGIEPTFSDTADADERVLRFAWTMVRDQVAESVEIGRKQSERGSRGGRPKAEKSGAKSGAKTTAKSGALSGAKSGAKSVRYGNVPIPTDGVDAPDGRTTRPRYTADQMKMIDGAWHLFVDGCDYGEPHPDDLPSECR